MCMCELVCMCVHVFSMYVCVHACVFSMYVCACVFSMYVCACVFSMYVCVHVCLVCMCVHVCFCVRAHPHQHNTFINCCFDTVEPQELKVANNMEQPKNLERLASNDQDSFIVLPYLS